MPPSLVPFFNLAAMLVARLRRRLKGTGSCSLCTADGSAVRTAIDTRVILFGRPAFSSGSPRSFEGTFHFQFHHVQSLFLDVPDVRWTMQAHSMVRCALVPWQPRSDGMELFRPTRHLPQAMPCARRWHGYNMFVGTVKNHVDAALKNEAGD